MKPIAGLLVMVTAVGGLIAGCRNDESAPEAEGTSSQPSTGYRELIARRPDPDLARLAERSSPGYKGEDTGESFYDILKLRDIGDTKAVAVLERILVDHTDSTRIHGFAAAQALFCIDTPQAHKILAKHLLTSQYNTSLAIDYTFHWEMPEPQRSRFIEQYHLQNLSKDLALELTAKPQQAKGGQRIDFTLVLRNVSDKAYRVPDRQVYLGQMLYFQDQNGLFAGTESTVLYYIDPTKWVQLAPGDSHKYDIAVRIKAVAQLKNRYRSLSKDASLVADTFDMMFDIKKAGRFNVYAMIEQAPFTQAQIGHWGFDNPWSGRAVSKPVTVEIFQDE
ncbi:MAG: hypothetical protein ACYTEL_21525 [Planctomycetota bacterium]|jgi:hypothetical protein